MSLGINSNEDIVEKINEILNNKKNCVINIVNDKLTLSVFSLLEKNLKNVREINFIIRNTKYIPKQSEISKEFNISGNAKDMLFNSYDIVEKNKLQHFKKAKNMYEFIKKHVNVKKVKKGISIGSNIIIIDEDFMIQGSSSLELSSKATNKRSINFDTVINSSMDKNQIINAKNTFNKIWFGENITEDFKNELLKSLSYVYKDHSPEFLYYFTLNELFEEQLDYGIERFEKDNINFKKTEIWDMLFDFQKDAVLSAIQKINKYNGCIIADSVGLGKTFEALAVIKYFELRQDNVLVLTPAKLYENWASFKGQNLQDCDCIINYDIQWNPVSLIQRFGRIDRIGSKNKSIKMINFFPAMDLNEYLSLEQRVKGKMISVNLASTGDEDILTPEMNDINFRKRQLEKLKDEVIDIEDANDNISLTDLNMNEYLFELSNYIEKMPEIKEIPRGIYSITKGEKQGVIFCFKHKNMFDKPKNESSLYPYYLLYISNDGEVYYTNNQAREVLKEFRKICFKNSEPLELLIKGFLKETKNTKDMSMYSKLLSEAIKTIQGSEEEVAMETMFDFGGFNNEFANESEDDFELISLLVVK